MGVGVGAGSRKAGQLLLQGTRGAAARATGFTRVFSESDSKAIQAAREVFYGEKDFATVAGTAGHEAAGAAPHGIDFVSHKGSFQQELKLHFVPWIDDKMLATASQQSMKYTMKYQLEEGWAAIRSVKHIWISPTDAVMLRTH
jgi:hypothetical protein